MKQAVFTLLMFCVFFTLSASRNCRAAESQPRWTLEDTMKTVKVQDVRVSPDGKLVAVCARKLIAEGKKYKFLAHIYRVDADGGNFIQLTRGDKSCVSPQWSPDGKLIAFMTARSGKNQVWVIPVNGGEAYPAVTAESGIRSFKWSPQGKSIAFTAIDSPAGEEEKEDGEKADSLVAGENIRMTRLWIVPFSPGTEKIPEAKVITGKDFSVGSFNWSPDGKSIVFEHIKSPLPKDEYSSSIYRIDLAAEQCVPLAATDAAESQPYYSGDGRWVAYVVSDESSTDFSTRDVNIIPAEGGKPRTLALTFDRHPRIIGWSKDGREIFVFENRKTTTALYALPVDGKPPRMFNDGKLVISWIDLNRTGEFLGFFLSGNNIPPEAYISGAGKYRPRQVSRFNGDLPVHLICPSKTISWKSDDGREIEGILTYPADYEDGKKYPLLVYIHGGPAASFRMDFLGSPNYYPLAVFSNLGCMVLRPNIRGSTGYGNDFCRANLEDWGGMDYRDFMTGIDYLVEKGLADGNRLGIMGWSYGGYMTAWSITRTNRFKAASVGAGVTDLVSMVYTDDLDGLIQKYLGGDYWEKPELYLQRSAMSHINNVTTPTLIQHGMDDDRVPYFQGVEFYNALRRKGVTVRMVSYPGMGHDPGEADMILDVMKRNLEWFTRYIPMNGG